MNERPLIDLDQEKILSLAQETQFAANGIVSRTVFRTPAVRLVLFGFAAGQELSEHTATQPALMQILSGEADVALAGRWHRLKGGDLLYLPPNLPHAVRAPQQFSMLLTLITPGAAATRGLTGFHPQPRQSHEDPAGCDTRGGSKQPQPDPFAVPPGTPPKAI